MTEAKLQCENLWCQKLISYTKSSFGPLISVCCLKVMCSQCFDDIKHTCDNRRTLNTDHSDLATCSRCKIRNATLECKNCFNEPFCIECSRSVHSGSKFSFHSLIAMTSVKSLPRNETQRQLTYK